MNPRSKLLFLPMFTFLALQTSEASLSRQSETGTRDVAILVYEGVELLDFAAPGEVFTAAHGQGGENAPAFRVFTVAEKRRSVQSKGFIEIAPEYSIGTCPAPDILIVPGGDVPLGDGELEKWLVERSSSSELVMSVSNGATLLASAGLLDGLEATTHRGSLQNLALLAPDAKVIANRRIVDSGRILSCAGASDGVDGALLVVERMLGQEEAVNVASHLEHEWKPGEIAKLHAEPARVAEEARLAEIVSSIEDLGLEQALAAYRALPRPPSQQELDSSGHVLLEAGKTDRAIALFRLVVAAFPESAGAEDSLSYAYERKGDLANAVLHAEEALARLKSEAGLSEERSGLIHNAAASRLVRLRDEDKTALRYECPPCESPCDDVRYLEATLCPGCGKTLRDTGVESALSEEAAQRQALRRGSRSNRGGALGSGGGKPKRQPGRTSRSRGGRN